MTITLGGKFCELYLDALTEALRKVKGVTSVDIEGKKGSAVVTGEPGAMKIADLREAVNGVKGEGWYCEAQTIQ